MEIASSSLRMLAIVVFGAIWTLALTSWFAMIVYGFKAVRQPRPGVRLWSRATLWNPANALLRPEFLTEQGQRYRSRCFRALLVFVASVGSLLFVGALTGTLK
jgi:hypothetical protein